MGEGSLDHFNQTNGLNANIQATIIMHDDNGIDAEIDEEPTVIPGNNNNTNNNSNNNQQNAFSQSFNLGGAGLANLLQNLTQPQQQTAQNSGQQPMMGGLNIGGLMSMFGGIMNPQNGNMTQQQTQSSNTQQNTQQQQQSTQQQTTQQSTQQGGHVHGPGCNHNQPQQASQQPQQASQQQPQQFPQLDLNNLASMASMMFNPPQQQQSTQQPQQPQQQNPMGGLMGIFNSLQQSGGMGEIMGMSLG